MNLQIHCSNDTGPSFQETTEKHPLSWFQSTFEKKTAILKLQHDVTPRKDWGQPKLTWVIMATSSDSLFQNKNKQPKMDNKNICKKQDIHIYCSHFVTPPSHPLRSTQRSAILFFFLRHLWRIRVVKPRQLLARETRNEGWRCWKRSIEILV